LAYFLMVTGPAPASCFFMRCSRDRLNAKAFDAAPQHEQSNFLTRAWKDVWPMQHTKPPMSLLL
jgi:hypothetical protein